MAQLLHPSKPSRQIALSNLTFLGPWTTEADRERARGVVGLHWSLYWNRNRGSSVDDPRDT